MSRPRLPIFLPIFLLRLWRWLCCLTGHHRETARAGSGIDQEGSTARTTDVESGHYAPIDLGRPGWPVWYDLWYHARIWFCLHTGGHKSAGGYAYMACTRCPGSLYDKDAGWTRAHGLYGLWWRQVNRYRDTLRPWLMKHPRQGAWFGLAACPRCGDIQHPADVPHCDVCHFDWMIQQSLRAVGNRARALYAIEDED